MATKMNFVLRVDAGKTLEDSMRTVRENYARFHPNGEIVLNRTEWKGKPPRSCAIMRIKGHPDGSGSMTLDIEVTHRPQGEQSYIGETRYDGWTALRLRRSDNGALLNEDGQPIKDGEQPAFDRIEVYKDIDFNDLDFGQLKGEVAFNLIKQMSPDEAKVLAKRGSDPNATFFAPHRSRPLTKIVLSNAPSGEGRDGFGTRLININLSTEHLENALMTALEQLMRDFIEGKTSVTTCGDQDGLFVKLSDALVDCEPNELGLESCFDVLHHYTPIDFLTDLARKLMSIYAIDISVVPGKGGGLVLRREKA